MTAGPPRRSGVLLHLTALPGPHGSGDLGPSAHHFVDWLAAGEQTVWQVLPLGVTGPGNSPYMSPSAFAGNPLLVDLGALRDQGWLSANEVEALPGDARRVDFGRVAKFRFDRLHRAANRFFAAGPDAAGHADFLTYCRAESSWLDDDALFMALRQHCGGDLNSWPPPLRRREPAALAEAAREHAGAMANWRFIQWCFDRQWADLRAYAHRRGVMLVGDLPIFVADNGVDVWSHPELFELGVDRRPRAVAGVPPDYFSASGQLWGNPLYRWPAHEAQGFSWWIARLRRVLRHCDRIRIDHFRGFEAYWEIPATANNAVGGRWVRGPGENFFRALAGTVELSKLLAEDLGVITPGVRALRRKLGIPGMRVLQFAFDGKAKNPYLPHNHERDCVVYTGTHDNDTTVGWWAGLDDGSRQQCAEYFGRHPDEIAGEPHWHLIRAAQASVAEWCMVPMQDVLGLGSEARMNRPGLANGCWDWRFTWDEVGPSPAERLREMARRYGRSPAAMADDEPDEDDALSGESSAPPGLRAAPL